QRNMAKLDESSKECAGMIVSKAQRLQALIKGLLEYAAAEEHLESTMTDCNGAVERALEDLDSLIEANNAQVTADLLPVVDVSESQLIQVLSNLIGNGIKYRVPTRTPKIHISAKGQGDAWMFCVSDNGMGLDMKHAEDIFAMFKRLHGSAEYEGSGIGLA